MWFKPYGHVVDMRPMDMEADDDSLAFIVQMSCKEEAINAFDALNGKSIMRGSHHVGKPCRVITQQMPQDVVIPLFEIVSVLFALFLERSATEPQLLARRSREDWSFGPWTAVSSSTAASIPEEGGFCCLAC